MNNRKTKTALQDIYQRLFKAYGPQHWWPAESPFEVMVGAILTQSAAWSNVEKAISNLKDAGTLSAGALRDLPHDDLAKLIFPSGYYNAKARKLKALAVWLKGECGDSLDQLFKQDTTALRLKLLAVYGIGEETADSILLYAGGHPVFVIDAYTRRIMDRVGLAPAPGDYGGCQKLFTDNLPADAPVYNEYHALLVRLGKESCRKKPVCLNCCLNPVCSGSKNPA